MEFGGARYQGRLSAEELPEGKTRIEVTFSYDATMAFGEAVELLEKQVADHEQRMKEATGEDEVTKT